MANSGEDMVTTSLHHKVGSLPCLSTHHGIFRIPEYFKVGKTECYEPLVVSIGPLHYQLPSVQGMQEYKLRCLQVFLSRGVGSLCLDYYVNFLRESEDRIRMDYKEKINLSSDDFIEMVLLDSSFIITLLSTLGGGVRSEETRILKDDLMERYNIIERDLFLEENQLPFFVLTRLYEMGFGMQCPEYSFIDVVISFIINENVLGTGVSCKNPKTIQKLKASNIDHLLDLFRILCLPSRSRAQQQFDDRKPNVKIPSVVQLKAAGVQFVASKEKSLFDIQFRNGTLVIPKLRIDDSSESFIRSLLAYEIRRDFNDTYFLDYIIFLFDMINTPEDVHILVRSGIIDNWIGSDEAVTNLLNNISTNIPYNTSQFYYSHIYGGLNGHVNTKWNRWKAILSGNYFNHPWAIVSVIYAVLLLLLLTAMQTICGFTNSNH